MGTTKNAMVKEKNLLAIELLERVPNEYFVAEKGQQGEWVSVGGVWVKPKPEHKVDVTAFLTLTCMSKVKIRGLDTVQQPGLILNSSKNECGKTSIYCKICIGFGRS